MRGRSQPYLDGCRTVQAARRFAAVVGNSGAGKFLDGSNVEIGMMLSEGAMK